MKPIPQKALAMLRKRYPQGTRVELIRMNDPYAKLIEGDMGTITHIDDIGTLHIIWDNGSTLGVVYGKDVVRIIK